MSGWNLPAGCTLNDIDRLFEDSDEEQCLDTEVEDKLTEVPWVLTDEDRAEMEKFYGDLTSLF